MIIKNIYLKNFFRYGNTEQKLDISGTGITAICGRNGIGKSTCIVDSLSFAFYGKCRTDTIDEIVNRDIKKNCKVSVEFEQDGKDYKIIRYRAHEVHKNEVLLFEGDKDISGHKASETDSKIIDIIKMPYIAFTNSCVFSSELYEDFLSKTNSERLVIFENILSLKEITVFYNTIKDIIKENEKLKEEKKLSLAGTNSEISTFENTLNSYCENAKKKLLDAKALKDLAKSRISESKNKLKEYSIINIDEEMKKIANVSLKEELHKKIIELNKEKSSLYVEIPPEELEIYNRYKDVDFKENSLKEELHKEIVETLKTRNNGVSETQLRINSLIQSTGSLKKERDGYISENIELDKKIEKLKDATCPFCGQHLTSEKAEKELKASTLKMESNKSSIEEVEKELSSIEEQITQAREDYDYLIKEINELKEKEQAGRSFIPNSAVEEQKFISAKKIINNLEELKKKNSDRVVEIDNEISMLSKQIDTLQTSKHTVDELNNLSDKIKETEESIKKDEEEILKIDASVGSLYDKSYIDELKKNIETKKENSKSISNEINEIDKLLKHYSFLGECFSNKAGGFKKYFIKEMIPYFNERVNQYLPFFFNDMDVKINFDENLSEKIEVNEEKVGFKSFSQGQRQRAELSISFALFDVARMYFSNDNNLLILDEMDKGLDKFGIKNFVDLLEGFDKQLRILIVTHNSLLDEEIKNKIKISSDSNGFSIIEQ